MKKHIYILLIGLLILEPKAHALSFTLAGIGNASKRVESGTEYTPRTDFGAGALFEVGTFPFLGFEFGALYLPRKYEYVIKTPVDATITVKQTLVQYPLLLRAHFGEYISMGVGGYYGVYQSNQTTDTQYTNGSITKTNEANNSTNNKSDYGVVTSLALYAPINLLSRIVFDGRYTLSMRDNSNTEGSTKFNDMQFLMGLQIGF